MKKILFVLLVMGLALSSGPVWAKDGFYIGGGLGHRGGAGNGYRGLGYGCRHYMRQVD